MRMLTDKKALSPVVATILLCGVVLIVGTSVWSFTYTISSGLQTSYYEGVNRQIEAITERFTVEHVAYVDGSLHVCVYNYGEVDIEVDVYVKGDAEGENVSATPITHGEMVKVEVCLTAYGGDELSVTVASRRQNFVYATYVVPV